jgi:hypothetical protein
VNTELVNQLVAGVRLVQGLTGETLTLSGTDYSVTASNMITGTPEWVAGGLINKLSIIVTLLKADYPSVPAIDTLAQFRGYNFRLIGLEDAGLSWQIHLVQEQA